MGRVRNQDPVSVHPRDASQPRTDHCPLNPQRYQSRCPSFLFVDIARHHRLLNAGLGLLWCTPELRIQAPRASRELITASQDVPQPPVARWPTPRLRKEAWAPALASLGVQGAAIHSRLARVPGVHRDQILVFYPSLREINWDGPPR
ncbi:hypothetical protein AOLI_G00165300 [Acnodon oligacanthus]